MRRARSITVLAILFAAIACGDATFDGHGDDSDDSADAGTDATSATDAGIRDATVSDATGDEIDIVPGNILLDPSFESNASSGCGIYWATASPATTMVISTMAHSGSQSCLVCGYDNSASSLANNVNTEPLTGLDAGIYELAVWVMPMDVDASPASASSLLELYQAFDDGGALPTFGGGTVTVADQWQKIFFDAQLVPDHQLELQVLGYPNASSDGGLGCMLVDDVSLVAK